MEFRARNTGADYRTRSGIKKEDADKKKRFACLEPAWQEMGRTSSLKTLRTADIASYLDQYNAIEDRWWSLALKRCESRANFNRYIGKRHVLDSFFAMVDKELKKLFPNVEILLAYGSAGLTMKPTGKNEVAVPTTGSYKAAVRIFGKRCFVQDEFRSTVVNFGTGEKKTQCIVFQVAAESQRNLSGWVIQAAKQCPMSSRVMRLLSRSIGTSLLRGTRSVEEVIKDELTKRQKHHWKRQMRKRKSEVDTPKFEGCATYQVRVHTLQGIALRLVALPGWRLTDSCLGTGENRLRFAGVERSLTRMSNRSLNVMMCHLYDLFYYRFMDSILESVHNNLKGKWSTHKVFHVTWILV